MSEKPHDFYQGKINKDNADSVWLHDVKQWMKKSIEERINATLELSKLQYNFKKDLKIKS